MITSSRQKLQSLNDKTINSNVDGVKVSQTNHSKALGLNIDENLSWKEHIHSISRKLTFMQLSKPVKNTTLHIEIFIQLVLFSIQGIQFSSRSR